ncbi:MAG: ParB/RepB/Spo0J family partition protein [Fimbriimonadaceae bacterium]|nr:ParB/RepB/Spo0J family partition protein [Fimbriimonadaceae bacterium]
MRRGVGRGVAHLRGEKEQKRVRSPKTSAPEFESGPVESGASRDTVAQIPIGQISPNPRQPRTEFSEENLEELAASISHHGVLQPIVVRQLADKRFELIAGERRLRASQLAGLNVIPALVRQSDDQTSLEIALIENVQREEIGALEAAAAYQSLVTEFGLSQEEVAGRVGKSRSAIANTLRLLRLPEPIQAALKNGLISEGHARALLAVESEPAMLAIFAKVVREKLSVRETEKLVRSGATAVSRREPSLPQPLDANWLSVQKGLSEYFATKVEINRGKSGGKILIDFYGDEDLERILETLGFPT